MSEYSEVEQPFLQQLASDAFWNEVDKVLPDYQDRKDWLRMRGAALDL